MYFGYVTAAEPIEASTRSSSPPPEQSVELNWLNIFYAIEWVVFAGFAVFLWYRLVRDAVEREREEAEAEAAAAARTGSGTERSPTAADLATLTDSASGEPRSAWRRAGR